jgi:5-methylcytosine-specific restriction enzyme A
MSKRTARPCATRGCHGLTNGRYCDQCQANGNANKDTRPSASARGYNAHWRIIRQRILRGHPLCSDPWGIHAAHGMVVPATDVDHILPLNLGGTHAPDNLQPLCHSCHSRKTATIDKPRLAGVGGGK